jgi:hypothetical protein
MQIAHSFLAIIASISMVLGMELSYRFKGRIFAYRKLVVCWPGFQNLFDCYNLSINYQTGPFNLN